MSTQRDFDRMTQAWLAEGPTELADRVLNAALREAHETRQARRGLLAPWRFPQMHVSARLAAPILLVLTIGALGWAALGGGPTPNPSPSTSPSVGPTAPQPTASQPQSSPVAVICGHQLVPTLLLNVGCTYQSTVFEHPLTITLADQWLVGDERAKAVDFRGYAPSISGAEVHLIVLGDISDGGCIGFTTPLPNTPLPRTAAEYIAWLHVAAPSAVGPVSATVGGLPATAITIPNPDAITDCTAIRLGSTSAPTDTSRTSIDCFGGDCTLFVIDDGGRVLLLETVLRPYIEPSDPQAAERFLGGLRFAP